MRSLRAAGKRRLCRKVKMTARPQEGTPPAPPQSSCAGGAAQAPDKWRGRPGHVETTWAEGGAPAEMGLAQDNPQKVRRGCLGRG